MTNHVHLLCTPRANAAVSAMMQALGRQYVRYFNHCYRRTGTLWEGRYKSCLVQEEDYLIHLYRCIELNPVRAAMVSDPANYKWSSYRINALGQESALCEPHEIYLALGDDEQSRQCAYRELFRQQSDGQVIQKIRDITNQGLALGNERFIRDIEILTGRRMQRLKTGRPEKNRKHS